MSTIQPADVYRRVQLVAAELDLVRQEMGRRRDERAAYKITNAAPREVFFEATAMFRKADRFCFERTGEEGALPYPPSADEIQPAHCLSVVDAALDRVRQVKAQLRITETAHEAALEPSRQPSDCMMAVLSVNRQLNRLLEQPFSPSDVYQLLTLGAGYVARLCAHAGVDMPALPAFERKKRPGDVYEVIKASLGLLKGVMELGPSPIAVDDVLPSDCYDLASLLISEVVYFHTKVGKLPPPAAAEMYEVGHKLPSHCHQRAAQIEAGLRTLAKKGSLPM